MGNESEEFRSRYQSRAGGAQGLEDWEDGVEVFRTLDSGHQDYERRAGRTVG